MPRRLFLLVALLALAGAPPLRAQERPKIGETITTDSGLIYKVTALGSGPQPQTGDLMIIHGIGTLADGKEFWNTRTDGRPYEYSLGVDSVIRGFAEGMRFVREGDRIVITMKPELAYGGAASVQAAASAANRKEPGSNETVLALGLTLLPDAYQLHQSLARLQGARGDKPAALAARR
jgi:hypothetical protein